MKSFFNIFVLCGLVVLVGCSGDSPNQPTTTTTTTADVWQITDLVASDDSPLINTPISVTATVTLNGDPAPDGTSVEFTANGGVFSNGETLATVLSNGGEASIGFGAVDSGVYTIQARVRTVTRQISVQYRDPDTSGGLQIWSINPNEGSYDGGEQVTLTGKGIQNPVEVFFTVQGIQYQAIVDEVVPSVPLSSAGTIRLRTPEPTAADTTISSAADVKVVVNVGTEDEETQSYPAVFTYISSSVILGDPVIFGVEPPYGRSQGGETVFILGLNFEVDVTKALVKNFDQVFFTYQGEELVAQVERYSANQIEVITPQFSLTPLTDDENWGIKLTRETGDPVTKDNVFIVQKDIAQPEITGVSPTAGPMDGGTIVTITGHGFEIPIQVHFGNLEATDVQVYDDQSLADNDVITCRTPDYSQSTHTPPYTVTITVTNLQTGNNATSNQTFTFGDVLYVGQANPSEGQIGDAFVLYGAGYEDPLTVWFRGGNPQIEFEVMSVTGTEIALRSPWDLAPTCEDRSGDFQVILNESNRMAEGGNYTLLGDDPTITSVDPIFVDETAAGAGVDPSEIDIYGVRFADNLLVLINDYTITPDRVTVESSEHIHVSGIPAPLEFNLTFDFAQCTTDLGFPGIKQVPTAVNVTVRNLPLGCENTLVEALVYVPEDQTCVASPNLVVSPPAFDFPDTQLNTCSAGIPLTLENQGGGDLTIQTITVGDGFAFDAAGTVTTLVGPVTIPPLGSNSLNQVYYCPTIAGSTSATMVINSDNPSNPFLVPLNGNSPIDISTPAGPWTFPDQASGGCGATEFLTITNSGAVNDLTILGFASDSGEFVVQNAPPGAPLAPGGTYDVEVQFCPTSATPGITGNLTIDHDATTTPSPISITMTGNGTGP